MFDAMNKRFPVFSPIGYSDERILKAYKDHIEYVKKTCPSDRLLVFEAKDGWEPLCKFLGKEIPKESYPNVNDTNQFKKLIFYRSLYGYSFFTGLIALIGGLSLYLLRKYKGFSVLNFISSSFSK